MLGKVRSSIINVSIGNQPTILSCVMTGNFFSSIKGDLGEKGRFSRGCGLRGRGAFFFSGPGRGGKDEVAWVGSWGRGGFFYFLFEAITIERGF